MIPKEQIAHDLALAYINNRYGVDVSGDFFLSDGDGSGSVSTTHLPSVDSPKTVKVGTGQKGFLGIEKKQRVQAGYLVDDVFAKMINDYHVAYSRFLELLNGR